MKRFLLAVLLLFLLPQPAIPQTTNQLGFIQFAAWSCPLTLAAVSTTQCQAAAPAGARNYITDVSIHATSANAGTVQLKSGTGTNCASNTTNLTGVFNLTAQTGSVPQVVFTRRMPIVPTAAHAICATSTGASATYSVTLSGYRAP